MTSLRDIRLGLKTQLETISGLRAYDVWPTTINPPVAIVRPLNGTLHEDLGGSVQYLFEVTLLLQLGNLQVAQEQLDEYLATDGAMSILFALESDRTLGGKADSTSVGEWRDIGTLRVGADEDGNGPEFMGCRFDVEILA
jgi:hypothetical protein